MCRLLSGRSGYGLPGVPGAAVFNCMTMQCPYVLYRTIGQDVVGGKDKERALARESIDDPLHLIFGLT